MRVARGRKRTVVRAGLAAVSVAVTAGLTACGGSPGPAGQAAPSPPVTAGTTTSAAEVLQADGYQVDKATLIAPSQALLNLGVVDRASGIRGSDAEQVLIFSSGHPSAPVCKTTPAACTPAGMASEVPGQDPGIWAHADGLVLRITGTVAAFHADGLPA